jgi:hypothetical protein
MKVEHVKTPYWSVRIDLNSAEWPRVTNAWEDDEWIHRPIWQWVQYHAPDSMFTCNGMVLFRKKSDAEWFRMVWEQTP